MKWLNRDLVVGPYLALCTTEADYQRVLRHCKIPRDDWDKWVHDGADATTHEFTNSNGGHICAVCIRPSEKQGPQIAGMLVHEAVHVWQYHCRSIGEREPSWEFEAYSIQAIAQRLMYAYAETLH